MPRATKAVLDFPRDDLQSLVDAIRSIDGGLGWVNVTPGIPSESVQDEGSLFSWLVGARPQVAPLATFMPASSHSGKPGRLGILHAGGRLYAEGIDKLAVPKSWRCRQDHARRGLLFDVAETSPEEMARVMTRVVDQLAAVQTTGRYLAEVYYRS